jgi:iron-sulfur cluster repair protein YtfE (RIC family)
MAAKKKSKDRSPVSALLIRQHNEVKAIFKKLEGGRVESGPLLTELSNKLSAHMAIEQDIYYPAVKSLKTDLVNESYEEHSLAELGLKRLLATDPNHESFKSKVTACKELIEHHVEEEEDELFPAVDRKMKDEELKAMAKAMKARFEEVVAAGFAATVPKGTPGKTSADVSKRGVQRKAA